MHTAIGRTPGMALPWSNELKSIYETSGRQGWKSSLPYLWLNAEDETIAAEQRRFYMDQVTALYSKDFSCQLGDWCRDHGVKYIGHVVEDYEEHSRLGCGAGHYFRATKGQSWAGIDDIGGQIIPGNNISTRHGVTADSDASFYHYMLPQLGASAAAIDPEKNGQLVCEMYGAYGWNFGVKYMKWLTDFLVFQGVNQIVPHAFSMADYPDIDCPPHFYARGNNGEFPYFSELMKYSNRLCDLLGNGTCVADVAVMYSAENDWMNESMKIQEVGKELITHQINYRIIPTDVFSEREKYKVSFDQGKLNINSGILKAILVTESKFIDEGEWKALQEAAAANVPVYFVRSFPEYMIGDGVRVGIKEMDTKGMKLTSVGCVADDMIAQGFADIRATSYVPDLLATHFRKKGDIYCFFNTDLAKTIKTRVNLPSTVSSGRVVVYDVFNNQLKSSATIADTETSGEQMYIELQLEPYESLVLLCGIPGIEECKIEPEKIPDTTTAMDLDLSDDWKVSAVRSIDYPAFPESENWEKLIPYSREHKEFAGIIRYEKNFELDDKQYSTIKVVSVEHVYEEAEVWINGKSAGKRLTPPYRWNIEKLLNKGSNSIRIEVTNTPTRDTLHAPSPFGPAREIIEPSGMFGKITLS